MALRRTSIEKCILRGSLKDIKRVKDQVIDPWRSTSGGIFPVVSTVIINNDNHGGLLIFHRIS